MFLSLRSGLSVISRGVIAGAQQSYNRILKLFPTVSSLASASTRTVQQGQVCEFDGVNDYISFSESIGVDFSGSCWIKFDEITTQQGIYNHGNSVNHGYVYISGGSLRIIGGSSVVFAQSAGTITADVWHFIEWEFVENSHLICWVDGVASPSVTLGSCPSASTARSIGTHYSRTTNWLNGSVSNFIINDNQYNLNHASGTTAYDSSGNGNDGTLQNGAAFVVDNTLPPEADRLNLEGFSKATVLSASNSRVRFNTGVIPTFEASKIRVGWYQPYEITSATSGKTLCALNTTNGSMNIKIGSSTSLATNETLTFSGNTNSRTYFRDVIPAGYHVVEIVSTGSNTWDIYLDDALMTKYTYSASTEKTVNQVWVGPSASGGDGVAGAVFQEFKIWDDSDVLQVDVDMENSAHKNLVGGESPSTDTGSVVIIPRDESDQTNDIFGNPLQYSGSVYPRRPEYRNSYAASFDGVDDYINCGNSTSFDFLDLINIQFYLKLNDTGFHNFISKGVGTTTNYAVDYTGGLRFFGYDSGTAVGSLSGYTLSTGQWYHIQCIKDATHFRIFVDGIEIRTVASTATLTTNSNSLLIGKRETRHCDGYMSGVIIGDVAHYPLTEGAGDTAHDISGNGNHGTINNASTGTEGAGFWAGRIDGEANALNNNNGFSKRMGFNGATSYADTGRTVDSITSIKISFAIADPTVTAQPLGANANSATRFYLTQAGATIGQPSNTVSLTFLPRVKTTVEMFPTGDVWQDGIFKGNTGGTGSTSINVFIGARNVNGVASGFCNCIIFDLEIDGASIDLDSLTQVDVQSVRIPADTSDPTKDVLGDTLTNPAITDGYNGAETELDAYNIAEGDNPSPATNNNPDLDAIEFGTDFASNDAAYMRLKSSTENDRLITFEDDLTGDDKELVEKFTETP